MPIEQSPTSAFVRPRQENQRTRVAEKVPTESFHESKNIIKTSFGRESRDKGSQELNNNELITKYGKRNTDQANSSGIPRRSFAKGADADQTPKMSRESKRRDATEKNSPKPRRKLPAAPTGSSMKPRGSGHDSISRRSTPDHSRRSTPERQSHSDRSQVTPDNLRKTPENSRRVLESTRKTPEHISDVPDISKKTSLKDGLKKNIDSLGKTKDNALHTPEHRSKVNEVVSHKISDSSDKNSKISKVQHGSATLPSKTSESSKQRGILNNIKYNSLPRRHPSKNHSKFYLDIEGEEYMPKQTDSENYKLENGEKEVNEKNSSENGLSKVSSLTRNGKIFGSLGAKFSSNENSPTVLENHGSEFKQTHVALYKFVPRHKDELTLDEGDPVHVVKVGDDLWFEGTNLVSGKSGIFPSRYAADILAGSSLATGMNAEDQQFLLRFLGSVEVADYKGDEILCYAISKIVNQRAMLSSNTPPACTLQVSSRGIRVCDFDEKNQVMKSSPKAPKKNKGKDKEKSKDQRDSLPTPTHFFSLKNVTFCGNHPRDRRYFGFITKHPDDHRFACHVFMSKYSTDPVAQAVGDCFKAFYSQYLDYRAPTEDIYME